MLGNVILISLSFVSAMVYAFHVTQYSQKMVRQKVSKKITHCIVFLLSILLCMFSYSRLPYPIIYIGVYIAFLIFYKTCFDGKRLVFIFATGNFVFHLLCLKGVIMTLYSMVVNITMYDVLHDNYHHSITTTLLFFIATLFLIEFRKIYSEESIAILLNKQTQLRMITSIESILNIMLVIATIVYSNDSLNDWIILYHLFLSIMIIFSFYILFKYTVGVCLQEEYEIKTDLLEHQVKYQLEQYDYQAKYIKDLRQLKHDYSNQIKGLHHLLSAGRWKESQVYIEELDSEMMNINVKYHQYSNNVLIDAMLQDTRVKMEKMGGSLDGQLNIIRLPFTELQICTLFSNILNNAVEACLHMKDNVQRYIYLESIEEETWYIIKIENSFNGKSIKKNGRFQTTKSDQVQHGLGIEKVMNLMESINGTMEIQEDEIKKVFKLILLFPRSKTFST